jgi:hypothetical protein
VSTAEVKYLESHQAGAMYLVAAVGSQTAADLSLQTGRNVVDMGGFTGSDPTPTLAKLEGLIDSGQLHFVLLSSGMGGGRGGPGGGSSAATTARDAWIKAHGKLVTIPGASSTSGASLYYFAG